MGDNFVIIQNVSVNLETYIGYQMYQLKIVQLPISFFLQRSKDFLMHLRTWQILQFYFLIYFIT